MSAQSKFGDIESYYRFVNEAEQRLVDKNFSQASILYDSAFIEIEYPFSKDILNAAICNFKSGYVQKAFDLCEEIVKRSGDTLIFNNECLYKLKDSEMWKATLERFQQLKSYYLKSFDLPLREELERLKSEDQYYRRYGERQKYQEVVSETDKDIMFKLTEIFTKKGYPDEKMIGITLNEKGKINTQPQSIILLHYYQNGGTMLDSLLVRYVREGKLTPEEFAGWKAFDKSQVPLAGGLITEAPYVKINGKLYEYIYDESLLNRINIERKKIFLPTLEEFKKIIRFKGRNPCFQIAHHAPLVILPDIDATTFNSMSKMIKPVEDDFTIIKKE